MNRRRNNRNRNRNNSVKNVRKQTNATNESEVFTNNQLDFYRTNRELN